MTNETDIPPADEPEDPEEGVDTTVLPEDAPQADGGPELAAALEQARAEADEHRERYLRLAAELDNVRKRHARELEKARNFGVEGLAAALLDVADSLEMGLEAADTATVETLVDGKRATLRQLQSVMEKYGITSLYPEGEPFDPELHEAMTLQESDTAEPDTVLSVIQRGYQLNGRLLRPARVVVARAPADAD